MEGKTGRKTDIEGQPKTARFTVRCTEDQANRIEQAWEHIRAMTEPGYVPKVKRSPEEDAVYKQIQQGDSELKAEYLEVYQDCWDVVTRITENAEGCSDRPADKRYAKADLANLREALETLESAARKLGILE